MAKNPPAKAGDTGSIPGSGRSLGEGNGNPLQNSCLENPMDKGVSWATVCGIAELDMSECTHRQVNHSLLIKGPTHNNNVKIDPSLLLRSSTF